MVPDKLLIKDCDREFGGSALYWAALIDIAMGAGNTDEIISVAKRMIRWKEGSYDTNDE